MRSERNILRHELIGLQCDITDAKNKSLIGLRGKIIDETMKTVVIKAETRKRVQKKGTKFRIQLGDRKIVINGDFIAARPEDRIKKKFKKW